MKLKDIAEIQIGYQHRDKGHPINMGSTAPTGLSRSRIWTWRNDSRVRSSSTAVAPPTCGSIVSTGLRLRGMPSVTWSDRAMCCSCRGDNVPMLCRFYKPWKIRSFPITFTFSAPTLTASTPGYLAWFINQSTTQARRERLQRGSHIKIIPKSAFGELGVVLPPLAMQRAMSSWALAAERSLYHEPPGPGPQTPGKRPGAAGRAGTSCQRKRSPCMVDRVSQAEINDIAWRACDTFRGTSTRRNTRTTSW